ncbi:exodeoxyribonuclease III [Skermanella mucosa]|uniref:exodeoxyribonuclease III n=1 Tax=Skermanella mucosa TaxID=1789672 RepID=UPI00192BE853|nr:exodeoxyribonuclease III [Skermanella mucosa]UEM20540.1 exodeoxyribonuclease III [Skermanella mucosa]
MRIATWNINSVRLRLDLLLRLIDEKNPDVICLQETKTVDETFPLAPLAERGYVHARIHGMKSYNGVAILSRRPLVGGCVQHWCERQDCRHAIAVVDGIEIHSVYIPSGGDVPDPAVNPKFEHKLRFLDEMTAWWAAERTPDRPMVVVGDFNVAPLEHDVWSHKQMLDVVSHTPAEVERLTAMQRSIGWVDAVRRFVPDDRKLYTWWSYRAKDWSAADRGRRLDHIWVTEPLAGSLRGHEVLREARGWEPKPSDHVPVLIDLDV